MSLVERNLNHLEKTVLHQIQNIKNLFSVLNLTLRIFIDTFLFQIFLLLFFKEFLSVAFHLYLFLISLNEVFIVI